MHVYSPCILDKQLHRGKMVVQDSIGSWSLNEWPDVFGWWILSVCALLCSIFRCGFSNLQYERFPLVCLFLVLFPSSSSKPYPIYLWSATWIPSFWSIQCHTMSLSLEGQVFSYYIQPSQFKTSSNCFTLHLNLITTPHWCRSWMLRHMAKTI